MYLACVGLLLLGRVAGALDFMEAQTRHFTIFFGEKLSVAELRQVEDCFESAHAAIQQMLDIEAAHPIDVIIFKETGDFTVQTRLPFWLASATIDGTIYLQPVRVLKRRGVLDSTVRHEVCLALLYRSHGDRLPLWYCEGLAVYCSGEIDMLRKGLSGRRPEIRDHGDIDALLSDRTDPEKNRWGYVLAYEEVVKTLEGLGPAAGRRGKLP